VSAGRIRPAERKRRQRQLVDVLAKLPREEHVYVEVTAGEVHRAALLVHDAAQRFVPRFRAWIEPYLPQ